MDPTVNITEQIKNALLRRLEFRSSEWTKTALESSDERPGTLRLVSEPRSIVVYVCVTSYRRGRNKSVVAVKVGVFFGLASPYNKQAESVEEILPTNAALHGTRMALDEIQRNESWTGGNVQRILIITNQTSFYTAVTVSAMLKLGPVSGTTGYENNEWEQLYGQIYKWWKSGVNVRFARTCYARGFERFTKPAKALAEGRNLVSPERNTMEASSQGAPTASRCNPSTDVGSIEGRERQGIRDSAVSLTTPEFEGKGPNMDTRKLSPRENSDSAPVDSSENDHALSVETGTHAEKNK